jgi:metal-responsive CopG/Arc/MetJ family transcriptional regulator
MLDEKLVITPKQPKPQKPRGEDGSRVFSIRIKEEIVERIENIAIKTGRSRNELIATFLEYALRNCEIVSDNEAK